MKMCRPPAGLTLQESLENRKHEGKQMTTAAKPPVGAPSASAGWDAIQWRRIRKNVQRLQMRIAKAVRRRAIEALRKA